MINAKFLKETTIEVSEWGELSKLPKHWQST